MNSTLIQSILQKNNIDPASTVTPFSSGQINAVYDVAGTFVLKVEKSLDVVGHQSEILSLARAAGAKVPVVVDAGTIDGVGYLLMTKISGRLLSQVWLGFDAAQKQSAMEQLAQQLKILHGVSFDGYAIPRPLAFDSWKDALCAYTDFSGVDVGGLDDRTRENFLTLREFYASHEYLLEDAGRPVLVHNDVHFDNVLYENGVITGIIDFDFARQAPKDYELWHILDFFQSPKYFVDKEAASLWENFALTNELGVLRSSYPEPFAVPDLASRIRLYVTEDILSTLKSGATGKFNEKVGAYFGGEWLESVLFG